MKYFLTEFTPNLKVVGRPYKDEQVLNILSTLENTVEKLSPWKSWTRENIYRAACFRAVSELETRDPGVVPPPIVQVRMTPTDQLPSRTFTGGKMI